MTNHRYILQRLIPVYKRRMIGYEFTLKGYHQQLKELIDKADDELQNIQLLRLKYEQTASEFQTKLQQRVMSVNLIICQRLHLKNMAEAISQHNRKLRQINLQKKSVFLQITAAKEHILLCNKKMEKIRQTLLSIKD